MRFLPRYCLLIPVIILFNHLPAQTGLPRLYVNEFQADNESTLEDSDFAAYSDWIELYNAEDTTVDLSSLYLTDDLAQPLKWQIPARTTLAAGGYLVIWADGNDVDRHCSFQLSKSGEQIGLFTADGAAIDSLTFPVQIEDYTMGRYPDGGDSLVYFNEPTPGAANSTAPFKGVASDPVFSIRSGFYSGSQTLTLSADSFFPVYFTRDGSEPTTASERYVTAIAIDTTTAIRVRAFRDGYYPGSIITQTYFIDEDITLPVVSLATDPDNLFSDESGIYVVGTNGITGYCKTTPCNWNQDWERPVNLEYLSKEGQNGFQLDCGMKIGGGCTRMYNQKTLAIYARSEYGAGKIRYKIFTDKEINEFNNINLRNNGQDWYRALMRDGLMHTIVKDRMNIDWQAGQPSVVFINGQYWGIHEIREKHNEHYLESNYGVDPDAVDMLSGNASVHNGSATSYKALIAFIGSADMSLAENYDYVASQIDIDEYLNYLIAEIYYANIDWPAGNIKYWREQGDGHKWRWILFDTDLGFGAHERGQYNSNTLANVMSPTETYYANPPWSTLLIRKMMTNETFRNEFVQRFAAHIATTFETGRVLSIVDSLYNILAPEIPRHKTRWPKSLSFASSWDVLVNIVREFATQRPGYMLSFINNQFSLDGTATLTTSVNDPAMGEIYLNGVEIGAGNFSGLFFKNVPLHCQAVSKPGYRFVGWEGLNGPTDDSRCMTLSDDSTIAAVFAVDNTPYSGLVINEVLAINQTTLCDETGSYEDWIELHNSSNRAIDIGGLWITDDLSNPNVWQIPATAPDSTTIPAYGYLLLWADKNTEKGIWHVGIKLRGEGEQFGISEETDSGFVFLDSLTYSGQSADISLARKPNGSGAFTLTAEPTPGATNNIAAVDEPIDNNIPGQFTLYPVFPNPFNPKTRIRFDLPNESFVSLSVYDLTGRTVANLIGRKMSAGSHSIVFDAADLPSMIYFCVLRAGGRSQMRKMLLLK